jgi:hypothetical protein
MAEARARPATVELCEGSATTSKPCCGIRLTPSNLATRPPDVFREGRYSRRAPTQWERYQSSSRLAIPTRLPVCLEWMKRPLPM